jgi:hypothetical protein
MDDSLILSNQGIKDINDIIDILNENSNVVKYLDLSNNYIK